MCRYAVTVYTCGHFLERRTFTSDRCRDIPCPPVELTETTSNHECSRCARHRRRKEDGQARREQSTRDLAPDFNPFLGQAGQPDERTYREQALIAYRKRQDVEWEEAVRYGRHRQAREHNPQARELERAQDRHEAERDRMLAREDCDCQRCTLGWWERLTDRIYNWDDGN